MRRLPNWLLFFQTPHNANPFPFQIAEVFVLTLLSNSLPSLHKALRGGCIY